MDIIKSIEHEQLKNKIPELKVGNTVKVHVRIKEGNKERIQVFEGIIIKVQGGGLNQTFTVRKTSYGVGVEKTFLVHSPLVEKVELVRVGKARRAKLFYLRNRVGKSAKTKEQIGARIENREITIKEDLVEEEVENPEEVEEKVEEISTPVETVKNEANAEQNKEKAEEAEVAKAPEEAPAVETKEVKVEEVVDTVKEDPVEEIKDNKEKEEPAEEIKDDKEKEEPAEEIKDNKEKEESAKKDEK